MAACLWCGNPRRGWPSAARQRPRSRRRLLDVASYRAILHGVWRAKRLGAQRVRVFTEHPEIVAQLEGHGEVPAELTGLYLQTKAMLNAYRWSRVELIVRELNADAGERGDGRRKSSRRHRRLAQTRMTWTCPCGAGRRMQPPARAASPAVSEICPRFTERESVPDRSRTA